MGYTHYWAFMPAPRGQSKQVEAAYQRAIKECTKVILAYQADAVGDERLSGFSAHCKPGTYGGLAVNGKGDNAHEDFGLREHYSQACFDNSSRDFCKTARKPYDVVVTACLAILKHRLGNVFALSSDGSAADWDAGIDLAKRVLKLKQLANPIYERPYLRKVG